jgi:hypothetical protein
MDIQILISKKGTPVVIASQLHRSLGLKDEHFPSNCKKWLGDYYQFEDDIRKPSKMKDFAPRKIKGSIICDYYLGVELAKLISLNANSKQKKKVAFFLNAFQKKHQLKSELNTEQVKLAFELAKSMCSMKAQREAEEKYKQVFLNKKNGSEKEWQTHRNNLIGFNKYDLQDQVMRTGRMPGRKSSRELLLIINKHELIRVGVIDLLKSMNKSDLFAKKMGELALYFAKQQGLDIHNDLETNVLQFKPASQELNPEVLALDYFENQAYSA